MRITGNKVNLCESCSQSYPECPTEFHDLLFGDGIGNDNVCMCNHYSPSPTIIPKEDRPPCKTCQDLKRGDTLYSETPWDGGIGFDYIRDIKFCPVCGRRLP